MHSRLDALYHRTATEHVLQQAGLKHAALVPLLNSPAELIAKIYEIFSVCPPSEIHDTNIEDVAQSIAAHHGLSLEKMRRFLIQKWLMSSEDAAEQKTPVKAKKEDSGSSLSLKAALDDSFGPEDAAPLSTSEEELTLRRAIFLLKGNPIEQTVAFLLNFMFMEKSSNITPQSRLRACRALFCIAPKYGF